MNKTQQFMHFKQVAICGNCDNVYFEVNKMEWKYEYFYVPGNSRKQIKNICPECRRLFKN
jgi:hypothetical protein